MTPLEANIVRTAEELGWHRREPIVDPEPEIITILLVKGFGNHLWVHLRNHDRIDQVVVSNRGGSQELPTTFRAIKKHLEGEK